MKLVFFKLFILFIFYFAITTVGYAKFHQSPPNETQPSDFSDELTLDSTKGEPRQRPRDSLTIVNNVADTVDFSLDVQASIADVGQRLEINGKALEIAKDPSFGGSDSGRIATIAALEEERVSLLAERESLISELRRAGESGGSCTRRITSPFHALDLIDASRIRVYGVETLNDWSLSSVIDLIDGNRFEPRAYSDGVIFVDRITKKPVAFFAAKTAEDSLRLARVVDAKAKAFSFSYYDAVEPTCDLSTTRIPQCLLLEDDALRVFDVLDLIKQPALTNRLPGDLLTIQDLRIDRMQQLARNNQLSFYRDAVYILDKEGNLRGGIALDGFSDAEFKQLISDWGVKGVEREKLPSCSRAPTSSPTPSPPSIEPAKTPSREPAKSGLDTVESGDSTQKSAAVCPVAADSPELAALEAKARVEALNQQLSNELAFVEVELKKPHAQRNVSGLKNAAGRVRSIMAELSDFSQCAAAAAREGKVCRIAQGAVPAGVALGVVIRMIHGESFEEAISPEKVSIDIGLGLAFSGLEIAFPVTFSVLGPAMLMYMISDVSITLARNAGFEIPQTPFEFIADPDAHARKLQEQRAALLDSKFKKLNANPEFPAAFAQSFRAYCASLPGIDEEHRQQCVNDPYLQNEYMLQYADAAFILPGESGIGEPLSIALDLAGRGKPGRDRRDVIRQKAREAKGKDTRKIFEERLAVMLDKLSQSSPQAAAEFSKYLEGILKDPERFLREHPELEGIGAGLPAGTTVSDWLGGIANANIKNAQNRATVETSVCVLSCDEAQARFDEFFKPGPLVIRFGPPSFMLDELKKRLRECAAESCPLKARDVLKELLLFLQ